LQKDLTKFQPFKAQIVAVSYDSQKVLAEFAKSAQIDFPLLSDPGSKVIDAYRLKNESARDGQAGIPHPTTIVVGQDQIVQFKLLGKVRKRHSTEELVRALKGLN
jgi:peroxiredoxin